jgi:acetylornithine deacetylase/succinyl-diaminopimelate desuccinylase-like protein
MMRYLVSKTSFILLLVILSRGTLSAQEIDLSLKEKNEILSEFKDYLSILNVSDDVLGIQNNLDFLTNYLTPLGFEVTKWKVEETPYLYADLDVGAEKTLLIYLQLDALPADGSKWEQKDPFTPVLKQQVGGAWLEAENLSGPIDSLALFARGASDSKGPAFSLLYALKHLDRRGINPQLNIKIIGDTEEEKGSKNLTSLLTLKSEQLVADALLILDGTRSLADVPTLTFGARGIATMKLTVYGAPSELHSGQYSGISPNPWYLMNHLVASMVGDHEEILIDEFDPYKESATDLRYFESLVLGTFDKLESRLKSKLYNHRVHPQQVYQHPSLILRGISSNSAKCKNENSYRSYR